MFDAAPLRLRTFASPFELRTRRLLLRQWKDSDYAAWAVMNADAEVRKYFPKVLNREDADGEATRIRAGIAQRGWGMWAIEVPGVHPFVGFVGLSVPAIDVAWMPAVEVGLRLARDAWGQGYATEAAAAALHFAFNELALNEVVAMSVVPNTPSHRVMDRLGMVRDPAADFDHPRVPQDWALKRHILHRITAEQFAKRQHTWAVSSISA